MTSSWTLDTTRCQGRRVDPSGRLPGLTQYLSTASKASSPGGIPSHPRCGPEHLILETLGFCVCGATPPALQTLFPKPCPSAPGSVLQLASALSAVRVTPLLFRSLRRTQSFLVQVLICNTDQAPTVNP